MYIVNAHSNNPEFPVATKELEKGIENDGFVLVLYDDDRDVLSVTLNHVTVMELAEAIHHNSELMQAAAIAMGLRQAKEILRESQREEIARKIFSHPDYDEEEENEED